MRRPCSTTFFSSLKPSGRTAFRIKVLTTEIFQNPCKRKFGDTKNENPAQQITGEWLEILAAAAPVPPPPLAAAVAAQPQASGAGADSAAEAAAAATLAAPAAPRPIRSPPQASGAGEEAIQRSETAQLPPPPPTMPQAGGAYGGPAQAAAEVRARTARIPKCRQLLAALHSHASS